MKADEGLANSFLVSSTEGEKDVDIFGSRYTTRAVGGLSCVYHEESNLNGIWMAGSVLYKYLGGLVSGCGTE